MLGAKWLGPILLPIGLVGCPGSGADGDDSSDAGSATAGSGYGAWLPVLDLDETQGALLSVWGESPDDVWAVGGQVEAVGDAGVGLLMHSNGTAWTQASLPEDTPSLNWVHGVDGQAWAVGNAGVTLQLSGGAFATVPSATDVALWGVFVVAADDAWAVGGDAFDFEGTGAILHWDGTAWTAMPLPELDRSSAALFKVWAAATDDVWAVGDAGIILHYDGTVWSQVQSGTDNDLISLWGTGPDDIVAVGGRSLATIARWDGTSWTASEVPEIPGLNGIWMDDEGVASLVGNRGSAALLLRGTDELNADPTTAELLVLHAVYGFAGGPRIAVGGSLDRSPPYVGIILEAQ